MHEQLRRHLGQKDAAASSEQRLLPEETQEKIKRVVSSFNTSPEAVITLQLTESPAFVSELAREFNKLYKDTKLGETFSSTFVAYCQTLISMGIAEADTSIRDIRGRIRKRIFLTDFGLRYGQPIAAAFLDFEQRNKYSLYSILGQTAKARMSEHRVPFVRSMTLLALQRGEKSIAGIERELIQLGIDRGLIGDSLFSLAQVDAVILDTLLPHMQGVEYSFTGKRRDEVSFGKKISSGKDTITALSLDICERVRGQGVTAVTRKMIYGFLPERIKLARDKRMLLIVINTILIRLEDQKYLERSRFYGGKKQSSATLTEKGRVLVNELLKPLIDVFLTQETLLSWRKNVLPKVRDNLSSYAEETGPLYYPYSKSGRKKMNVFDRRTIVALLLESSFPFGHTTYEISKEMGIPYKTTETHMKRLLKDGWVVRRVINGISFYAIV